MSAYYQDGSESTVNLNANINACIKPVEYVGHTTHMNICTGRTYDVPWGTMTWLAPPAFVLMAMVIAMVSYKALRA